MTESIWLAPYRKRYHAAVEAASAALLVAIEVNDTDSLKRLCRAADQAAKELERLKEVEAVMSKPD